MDEKAEDNPAYPLCILPQPIYKDLIDEIELWAKVNGLQIQRRCAENVEGSVLTPEVFGNNIAEMSVNLLGGDFQPEYVKFTPKGPKPIAADIPFEVVYSYSPDAKGVYITISDINGCTFPSTRKFPNQQEYEKVKGAIEESGNADKARLVAAFNKRKGFNKDTEYDVKYRIRVMHRPTNANYWHCQIEIAPDCEDGKTVNKEKAEWQKDALRVLTNFLVVYASFEHKNPIPSVKKEWYIKHPA